MPTLLGAVTAPLVGIAGEYSAVPFGVIIFTTSLLSIISYAALAKNTKTSPLSKKMRV
ncbi:hypothetical protein V7266_18945 [Neobacillus drentensis]|uniref:hypothetical protein n=1 Tax=Neobacillus drentensis TaxID=220684 RepID=UPI002FFE26C2